MKRLRCLSVSCVVAVLLSTMAAETPPSAAIKTLLKQSHGLQMLALGERHGSVTEHAFLTELVQHPGFSDAFPVIVVEFGNALYQSRLDKYLAGGNVPPEELKAIWQSTTVPLAWDSPLYAQFFETVRNVNRAAPTNHKIRVLLGDPPIDWSQVNSVSDFTPYMDRDAFYASVMEKNCGAQRCLLICGTNHFYWKDPLSELRPPSSHKNVLEYYLRQGGEREKVEVVLPSFSKDTLFVAAKAPSLLSTRKPPLQTMRFGQVDQSKVSVLKMVNGERQVVEVQPGDTLPLSDVVDWVLYLGGKEEKAPAPAALYRDKGYIKELYRRDKIVGDAFGFDLTSDVREVDPDAN